MQDYPNTKVKVPGQRANVGRAIPKVKRTATLRNSI